MKTAGSPHWTSTGHLRAIMVVQSIIQQNMRPNRPSHNCFPMFLVNCFMRSRECSNVLTSTFLLTVYWIIFCCCYGCHQQLLESKDSVPFPYDYENLDYMYTCSECRGVGEVVLPSSYLLSSGVLLKTPVIVHTFKWNSFFYWQMKIKYYLKQ